MRKRPKTSNVSRSAMFASDPDPSQNACPDRVTVPWCLYADGYRKAGRLVADACKTFYDRNTLLYPIGFLYRQYVELALKQFVLIGNRLVKKPYTLPQRHDLSELWTLCKKVARERKLPMSAAELKGLEAAIRELNAFDPTSENFRYPVNRRGAPSSPGALKKLSIRGLAQAMDRLAARLRELENLLYADLDLEEEFRSVYAEP